LLYGTIVSAAALAVGAGRAGRTAVTAPLARCRPKGTGRRTNSEMLTAPPDGHHPTPPGPLGGRRSEDRISIVARNIRKRITLKR